MSSQVERELSREEREQTGLYSVLLSSVGNPDFGENPERALPGTPSHRVGVDTIAEAAERCTRYIGKYGLGGGNWAGGEVIDETNGSLCARISYNGRCWLPTKAAQDEHAERRAGSSRIAAAVKEAVEKARMARQARIDGRIDMTTEAGLLAAQTELFSALCKSARRDERVIHSEYGSKADPYHPKAVTALVYLAQEASRYSGGALDDLVLCALKAGCLPDAGRDHYECTPLHNAAEDGKTGIMEALLRAGADVTATDRDGRSPLHLAAREGRTDAMVLLLSCGADITAKDHQGRCPMSMASKSGAINVLVDAGASVQIKDHLGRTALHKHVDGKTIKRLLELGADPNAVDHFGNAPLHINAYSKSGVAELLKAGAQVDTLNNFGQSPLSIAICGDETLPRGSKRASPGAAEALIMEGADPGKPVSGHNLMSILEACEKGMVAPGMPRSFDIHALMAKKEALDLEREATRQTASPRRRI